MIDTFEKVSLPQDKFLDTHLYLSTEIHSELQDFRNLIRQSLWIKLRESGVDEFEKENVLDLHKLPKEFSPFFVNISHSKKGSAFIVSKHKKVGIDIEDIDRISIGLINRVSNEFEQQQSIDSKLLFSAKESCWKAVESDFEIPTISQIETTNWRAQDGGWSTFSAKYEDSLIPGEGWVLMISDICLSFFICP